MITPVLAFHVERPLTMTALPLDIVARMDVEQTIADIECLERIYALPDARALSPNDLSAANRRHDEMHAHSPWFRLWERYGICCR